MTGFKTICIVGGGLSGLSTAYHILRSDASVKAVILEASDRPGGLLKSESVGGYLFDAGGSHILFSKDPTLLNELLSFLNGNYVKHRRNSKVYYRGIYVKYPFENGLGDLPPEERFECVWSALETYLKRVKGELRRPTNFREWLPYVFGEGIASKYLIPYNEKIWKTDLSNITLEWVEGRVPAPPLKDIVMSAVGMSVEGYTHQLTFYYPSRGGIESLIRGMIGKVLKTSRAEIAARQAVERILAGDDGGLTVETRELSLRCDAVVYTASLRRSGGVLRDLLGEDAEGLERLKSVPIAVVGLGVRGEVKPYHWVYLPDREYLPHRVAVLSNYSGDNAPRGRVSLIAEVSFSNEDELNSVSDNALVSRVYEDVVDAGLVSSPELEVGRVWRWSDAYVLYDGVRASVLNPVLGRLRERGVFLNGRFGSWEYLNMDAVYRKSFEVANTVLKYLQSSREALRK